MGKLPRSKVYVSYDKIGKKCAADWYTATFQKAVAQVQQESYQLLILDEILPCIQEHFLPESLLLDFLEHKPEGIEIVLTGRSASNAIRQKADYITEMKEEKHPYTKGIPSRIGIEF